MVKACSKEAVPSIYDTVMPNMASSARFTLPVARNAPSAFSPFIFSTVSVAGVGPPSGMSVPYTCQPAFTCPLKRTRSLPSGVSSFVTLNVTGVCICAKPGTQKHRTAISRKRILLI